VEAYREAVSCGEENTFERDVSDCETIEATVLGASWPSTSPPVS